MHMHNSIVLDAQCTVLLSQQITQSKVIKLNISLFTQAVDSSMCADARADGLMVLKLALCCVSVFLRHGSFFFLEYAGELRIFVFRGKKKWSNYNRQTTPHLRPE
jgi:hypothetical protein